MGPLGEGALYAVLDDFGRQDGPRDLAELLHGPGPSMHFNGSCMAFLPKSASGRGEEGEFYDPGDTRPLNIVN